MPHPEHRCGFVAICGRPNVGKSTLLNALVGQAVAVAAPQPQTTRERLLGIWSRPGFQVVLVDTPGIHRARSALNKFMVGEAIRSSRDVDLVLLLAETPAFKDPDAAQAWRPGDVALEGLAEVAAGGAPIVLVLTKSDLARPRELLLPVTAMWSKIHEFAAIVPVSALTRDGLERLELEVLRHVPAGPPHFDPDQLSDRDLRWHARELVRAELFAQLTQELPYSCAVVIDSYREGADADRIEGTIFVERDGQKGMVIGKGGRTIKAICVGARARIGELTGRRCDLVLRVGVAKGWTKDPSKLAEFGYRCP